MIEKKLEKLGNFLNKIPAVAVMGGGFYDNGKWWIKLKIDIENEISWNIVQEFAHILNYLSLDEKLPILFYPVSAPPYLNGGPKDFLFWIIEATDVNFSGSDVLKFLEGRLPNPVDSITEWQNN